MKKFFAIVAILLAFSTQTVFAHQKTETKEVKCEESANLYLQDAEMYYKLARVYQEVDKTRAAFGVSIATTAARLYQICSELEKNTNPHSHYSAPSGPAITDTPVMQNPKPRYPNGCITWGCGL